MGSNKKRFQKKGQESLQYAWCAHRQSAGPVNGSFFENGLNKVRLMSVRKEDIISEGLHLFRDFVGLID